MLLEVLCLCLIFCLPASPQVAVGGYTPFRCPTANEIRTFTSLLNAEISNYLGTESVSGQEIQILEVSTQVVAGTNYRIKVGFCFMSYYMTFSTSRFALLTANVILLKCIKVFLLLKMAALRSGSPV
ncbi:hypothetical protein X801_01130 [Opisthorchis viverrini]|uniref:Uncharacterized protein n=2 Tax=Opisthorchis viverrini TaxID=6198 RepID=A0A074ZA46_OPIVI|nr:hypothetical protein T265_11270 [Opisthorchis viverrini]KER20110.1 hypothetical protein T265_11270 [Opisthorchis viverrini]OON22966.1 hypothetical protein X801_01130 [Opisthorchis viverrini]